MATPDSGPLFEWLAARVADGWTAEADAIVSAKRSDLGNAATVTTGPRGGRRVVGAKPGGPPNKRSGRLQAGVVATVVRDGLAVTLTVDDPVAHAGPLQGRGYVVTSDVADRFADPLADAAVRSINDG